MVCNHFFYFIEQFSLNTTLLIYISLITLYLNATLFFIEPIFFKCCQKHKISTSYISYYFRNKLISGKI